MTAWWGPDPSNCAATVVGALLGLVVGMVLGLNGFSQPATPGPLGQSPRIKNLVWLFSGLLAIFMADFNKLNVPKDFHWLWPFCGYALGALSGAIGAVVWMTRNITASAVAFNSKYPSEFAVDHRSLQREYLSFGKTKYEDLWREEKKKAEVAYADFRQSRDNRKLARDVDRAISICVLATFGVLVPKAEGRRPEPANAANIRELMSSIVDNILAVVKMMSSPEIAFGASYMVYWDHDSASLELQKRAKFTASMPSDYMGYLELCYGGGLTVTDVVLPVARDPDHFLPGAPEAAGALGLSLMNLKTLVFAKKVSAPARAEMNKFFDRPHFASIASVMSIVVLKGEVIHGVLNIESSAPNLLGLGDSEPKTIAARLQTLVTLLSLLPREFLHPKQELRYGNSGG